VRLAASRRLRLQGVSCRRVDVEGVMREEGGGTVGREGGREEEEKRKRVYRRRRDSLVREVEEGKRKLTHTKA